MLLFTDYSIAFRVRALLAAIAFFMCFASIAPAQSALDGFDPNANGIVQTVVVQSDGKILLGGNFTTVLSARREIASPG